MFETKFSYDKDGQALEQTKRQARDAKRGIVQWDFLTSCKFTPTTCKGKRWYAFNLK